MVLRMLKPALTTGLVIAGAYAVKLRRSLFAQIKQHVKLGQVDKEEVARASSELNSFLYQLIVERLGMSKGDVVRIRVEYFIEDGRIVWDLETLLVEAFRRVPEEDVKAALASLRQA